MTLPGRHIFYIPIPNIHDLYMFSMDDFEDLEWIIPVTVFYFVVEFSRADVFHFSIFIASKLFLTGVGIH